jgi:phytoene synthase
VTAAPAIVDARATLAHKSKSFALAGRLLPAGARDDAAVIYAWCRHADDAIDLAPRVAHAGALRRLRDDLAAVYGDGSLSDPSLVAFRDVVRRHAIPIAEPSALIDGLEMDAAGHRYETLEELFVYCFRVAGTVGLMMARLLGVRDPWALKRAVNLGVAMQLTNVCRDVAEDWARGRLYVPRALLAGPPPSQLDAATLRPALARLLAFADELYTSGRQGLRALPWRSAIAIDAAASIYRAIGDEIARRGYDVTSGRAIVPGWRKRALALLALARGLFGRLW